MSEETKKDARGSDRLDELVSPMRVFVAAQESKDKKELWLAPSAAIAVTHGLAQKKLDVSLMFSTEDVKSSYRIIEATLVPANAQVEFQEGSE